MKAQHYISMLVMTFVAIAGFNIQVAEANSPASVINNTNCAYNITIITNQGTVFGPQLTGPGGSYNIKVPTGETIGRIVLNGQSNNPNIPVFSCAAIQAGPAFCTAGTPPSRFCRTAAQEWQLF